MTILMTDGRWAGRDLMGLGGHRVPVSFIAGDRHRYVISDEARLSSYTGGKTLFLVDDAVINHPSTQELIVRFGGVQPVILPLHGGESLKDIRNIEGLQQQVMGHFPRPPETVFAVGGGALINAVNALVPLLSIDRAAIKWSDKPLILPQQVDTRNFVVVPTTILSVADVAASGKGNMNADGQKHAYKLFYNPKAVFLDPRYADQLPVSEIKAGLVECLKNAILQDRGLPQHVPSFTQVSRALLANKPDSRLSFQMACQAMNAKSVILGWDEREQGWGGFLLSYGHLHAHAYEMASNYKINHGEAVLFGMLLDQKLGGDPGIYKKLLKIATSHSLAAKVPMLQEIDADRVQNAYKHEPKAFFRAGNNYKVLSVGKIGVYWTAPPEDRRPEKSREFNWAVIAAAQKTVLNDIATNMAPQRRTAPAAQRSGSALRR